MLSGDGGNGVIRLDQCLTGQPQPQPLKVLVRGHPEMLTKAAFKRALRQAGQPGENTVLDGFAKMLAEVG